MQKEFEGEKQNIMVCDYCGERAIAECYFCGKDICIDCIASVVFADKEVVRNKEFIFTYDKVMCKEHLPKRRDCE